VILRPAIGVAKAGGQILMGATNAMDPVNLQRAEAVSSVIFILVRGFTNYDRNTRNIDDVTKTQRPGSVFASEWSYNQHFSPSMIAVRGVSSIRR